MEESGGGDESGGNLNESSEKEVEVRCEERRRCRKLGDGDGGTIQMDSGGLHQRKGTVGGREHTTELHKGVVKHRPPHQSRITMRGNNNKKSGN